MWLVLDEDGVAKSCLKLTISFTRIGGQGSLLWVMQPSRQSLTQFPHRMQRLWSMAQVLSCLLATMAPVGHLAAQMVQKVQSLSLNSMCPRVLG